MDKALELTMIYALEAITRNSPGYKMTHTITREQDDDGIPMFFKSKRNRRKSLERISVHISLVKVDEEQEEEVD